MAPKIKLNRIKYRKNDALEITKDLGCIPAGTYILRAKGYGFYCFGITDTAVFCISDKCKPYLRKISSDYNLTRPDDFIKRYYALLAYKTNNINFINDPKTYCAVDPRALRFLGDEYEVEERVH